MSFLSKKRKSVRELSRFTSELARRILMWKFRFESLLERNYVSILFGMPTEQSEVGSPDETVNTQSLNACATNSSDRIPIELRARRPRNWVRFLSGTRDTSLLHSRLAAGSTHFPMQCALRVLSSGLKPSGPEAATYFHLVPSLKMCFALSTLPNTSS
jgi:hypothetical protein